MNGKLFLKDGTKLEGQSFGSNNGRGGEVVFSTGMVGYPESLTDPSYKGQILVLTYPSIGNYGVPRKEFWESDRIQASGLIVSEYNTTPSHFDSDRSLSDWLSDEGVPALVIKDTRELTQKLRDKGSQLGKIELGPKINWYDPNKENLVSQVGAKGISFNASLTKHKPKNIIYIDCGGKKNMIMCLRRRGANVIIVPWDFNPLAPKNSERIVRLLQKNKQNLHIDGYVVSNGPGDPKFADKTVQTIKELMKTELPILGICLGHQLITLAGGGDTKKLKFGHRAQNQPCLMIGSERCFITTQNHGFAVSKVPDGFKPWFVNANDNSNEGIIHKTKPWMSVQFHPEATPGPVDTEWIFDYYLSKIKV